MKEDCAALGFSVEKAHETQLRLSRRLILDDRLPKRIRFVAGVDVAYTRNLSIGAVAVMKYGSLELVESATATCETRFPYVPTLLSFREIPPAVSCIRKLQIHPDILLVDGQGLAHPYRCGFACHLGLVTGSPTIGVAKSRLFGEVKQGSERPVSFLQHEKAIVGAVVQTRSGCRPIYVSVGHMVSLETAIQIVKHCVQGNRIPEPVRKAHQIAAAEKRKINNALQQTSKP